MRTNDHDLWDSNWHLVVGGVECVGSVEKCTIIAHNIYSVYLVKLVSCCIIHTKSANVMNVCEMYLNDYYH